MSFIIFARVMSLFFGVLFILFALVQYNDPDSAVWMLIYGASATVPLLAAFNRFSQRLLWLCMGLCLAGIAMSLAGAMTYFTTHMQDTSIVHGMSPDKPYIEDTREFFGTAIVALIVLGSQVIKRYKTAL